MAVSVKLAADIDRRLRALARERNSSHHYMMCEAIRRYVEDEEARLLVERNEARNPSSASEDDAAETNTIRFMQRTYRSYHAPAE